MTVSNAQIEGIINESLIKDMKEGRIPTITKLTSTVKDLSTNFIAGQPFFKAETLQFRDTTDAEGYNDQVRTLYKDLSLLYNEINSTTFDVINDFDLNDADRRGIEKALTTLERQVEQLKESMHEENKIVIDYRFEDALGIDFQNTTCIVDTELGVATLPTRFYGKLIPLTHISELDTVTLRVEPAEIVLSNELVGGSRFGDMVDGLLTSWKQSVITSEPQEVTAEFVIALGKSLETVDINKINLTGDFTNSTYIELFSSIDNINYTSLGEYLVKNSYAWMFEDIKAKYLKVKFRKNEPEQLIRDEGQIKYLYEFGIRSLYIVDETYVKEAELLTNALDINSIAGSDSYVYDKVQLSTTDEGSVDYFILPYPSGILPSGINRDGWMQITEDAPLDMRSTDSVSMNATDSWATVSPATTVNGIDFYEIHELPEDPASNSIVMNRGVNNWQKSHNEDEVAEKVENEVKIFPSGVDTQITLDQTNNLRYGSVIIRNVRGNILGDDAQEKEYRL